MRILVSIENELMKYGLIQLLKDFQTIEYMATTSNVEEFIEVVRKFHFDLIIVDFHLQGVGGLRSILSEIEQLPSSTKRVFMCYEKQFNVDNIIIKESINGLFHQTSSLEELMNFFQRIMNGERVYLNVEIKGPQHSDDGSGYELTKREEEVFHMKVHGYTVRETADLLNISPKTVENHRRNIRKKLQIKRNSEWYDWAKRFGSL